MTRQLNIYNFVLSLVLVTALLLHSAFSKRKINLANAATKNIACALTGKVINISDGDTLNVLDAQNYQHKVRLAAIDAPEKRQAFGNIAKKHLAGLVKNKTVCVAWEKRGRYGRIIGTVYVEQIEVNLDLDENGLAWHYKKYQNQQSPAGRERYAQAENNARSNNLGLWQDGNAIAPWQWRRQKTKTASLEKKQASDP